MAGAQRRGTGRGKDQSATNLNPGEHRRKRLDRKKPGIVGLNTRERPEHQVPAARDS